MSLLLLLPVVWGALRQEPLDLDSLEGTRAALLGVAALCMMSSGVVKAGWSEPSRPAVYCNLGQRFL